MRNTPENFAPRFWAKVEMRTPEECWLWQGSHGGGRGKVHLGYVGHYKLHKQKFAYASVVAWQLTNGVVPEGLFVLHRCDVPMCVNPNHLFVGTQRDNVADMIAKGRDDCFGQKKARRLGVKPNRSRGERIDPSLKIRNRPNA